MTPEGQIKAKIDRVLDSYFPLVYKFKPVPSGYGHQSVDYLVCAVGLFVGIEAKAPGKTPTSRQDDTLDKIRRAGGAILVISDDAGVARLDELLKNQTNGNRYEDHE